MRKYTPEYFVKYAFDKVDGGKILKSGSCLTVAIRKSDNSPGMSR